jgi:hypothetical protein
VFAIRLFVERKVFTKEDWWGRVKVVTQEIKRITNEPSWRRLEL